MGTTTRLQLPYPELTDPADVPADLKELAERLDAVAAPSIVTSLPGSPIDGQEVIFQNAGMAAAGVAWHLRYRAGATGAYKWEFLGGAPLRDQALADRVSGAVAGVTWFGIDADAPEATAPLAGDYDVHHGAKIVESAAVNVHLGVRVGATEPTFNVNSVAGTCAASGNVTLAQWRALTALAAGTVVTQRYLHSAASSPTVGGAWLAMTPVRVG